MSKYAKHIPWEVACKGEYIHTFESLMDIIKDDRMKDLCWLEDYEGLEDEIISIEPKNGRDFNVIVPKSLFKEDEFRAFCKENESKVYNTRPLGYGRRGIDT